jgi:hypothetical protein
LKGHPTPSPAQLEKKLSEAGRTRSDTLVPTASRRLQVGGQVKLPPADVARTVPWPDPDRMITKLLVSPGGLRVGGRAVGVFLMAGV